ncbi:MAG: rRNA maturation RNase YbeY [Ignavibacteria bacterium]|nr:rRNA maturation RNase YbeY [Ignavibacteria bacterium]
MVRRVLQGECKGEAEINVIAIHDRAMLALNSTYLGHYYATDVLSFPLSEDKKKLEGEVYVNLDQARRQAREYGVSMNNECVRLVIHGVLHLVGYTDVTAREKKRMTKRENGYLAVKEIVGSLV